MSKEANACIHLRNLTTKILQKSGTFETSGIFNITVIFLTDKNKQKRSNSKKHWSKLRIIMMFISFMKREDKKKKNRKPNNESSSIIGLRRSFLGQ